MRGSMAHEGVAWRVTDLAALRACRRAPDARPGRIGHAACRRLCLAGGLTSGLGLKADWFAADQARLDDRGAG